MKKTRKSDSTQIGVSFEQALNSAAGHSTSVVVRLPIRSLSAIFNKPLSVENAPMTSLADWVAGQENRKENVYAIAKPKDFDELSQMINSIRSTRKKGGTIVLYFAYGEEGDNKNTYLTNEHNAQITTDTDSTLLQDLNQEGSGGRHGHGQALFETANTVYAFPHLEIDAHGVNRATLPYANEGQLHHKTVYERPARQTLLDLD